MLKVVNNAEGAEIYITGDIIDDDLGGAFEMWGDPGTGYQWPDAIKKQLDAIDDDAPLTIYINSDGGSVPAGVAIANMIARHKGPTTAIVDGWACSIATQIFFAADVRKIPSNAYLMIHKPATCCCGDANDMEQAIKALDVIQAGLETTYNKVAAEDVTPDIIHQMVESTTWLTGKEASEMFQVELLEATKTAACVGGAYKAFRKMPEGIITVDKSEKPETPKTQPVADLENMEDINKIRAEIQLAIMEGELIHEEI
jgi:ATP-dependent protease ClpP protease subunit